MTLFWLSLGVLLYTYVGYPGLLRMLRRIRGERPIRRAAIQPGVSIVISAYNEAAVIREKLENTLAIDYPADRLEVVVVSDASTDGTDEIVREYEARGVRLERQQERRGKTAGLNTAVPRLRGEIVVFSDANAMYRPDAVRKLIRNFADPEVGCVTGEARYVDGSRTAADIGERTYWDYEVRLKALESALGSLVGGDGAIYAIRRELWQTLPETAINDFLNPLQIVAKGYRAVYEPEAICFEETAGRMGREFRRRVRIVSRSWRAVFQAPGVFNPFRVGLFALALLSHKVLRWWSAPLLTLVVLGFAVLLVRAGVYVSAASRILVVAVALFGLVLRPVRRGVAVLWYFYVINTASFVGLVLGTLGKVSGTWSPPRDVGTRRARVPAGFLWAAGAVALVAVGGIVSQAPVAAPRIVFWTAVAGLAYLYLGYPLCLFFWHHLHARPVESRPIEPTVCLLIPAYNEAEVIGAKLQNSLAIDYPRDRTRIVVVSDGSTDETNAIVAGYAARGVELIALPERRGKIAAINTAVSRIPDVSEILVLTDANTFLGVAAVRALVAGFADERVGAISGNVVLVGERAALAQGEDLYYRYERWLQRSESAVGSMIGVDGALYAIRRRLFVSPPEDTILDDVAIPLGVLQQDYRVVFEPAAMAFEQGSLTAREEFWRKSRVIAGAAQILGRGLPSMTPQVLLALLSHKALRWISPVFMLAALTASLALAPTGRLYAYALVGQFVLLGLGAAGCLPLLRRIRVVGLAHYFCLVHAAALVGLVRGMLGRQPATWRRFTRTPVPTGGPL